MKPVPIHRVKTELSKLIERACAGEEVVICRGKEPVVRLVPIEREPVRRRFGALKGKVTLDETFFEPLPDEELDARE